jgi:hypothetical protein
VLEVGAGIGANTKTLADLPRRRWVCLEPDPALTSQIELPGGGYEVIVGITSDLDSCRKFDIILYLDVIEHIEDDRAQFARAAALLAPGGSLVVLAPAHQYLSTPFDRDIGHFRRYSRASLHAAAPEGLREQRLVYLDSCGALASLGNRLLLRSWLPTERQILTWDRFLVRCSRWLDPILRHRWASRSWESGETRAPRAKPSDAAHAPGSRRGSDLHSHFRGPALGAWQSPGLQQRRFRHQLAGRPRDRIFDFALECALLFWLTSRAAGTKPAFAVTFLFFAFQISRPDFLLTQHRMDSTALSLASIVLCVEGQRRGKVWCWLAAGVLITAAAVCTPSIPLVAIATVVWLMVYRPIRRFLIAYAAGVGIGSAAILAALAASRSLIWLIVQRKWLSHNYSDVNIMPYTARSLEGARRWRVRRGWKQWRAR